MKMGRTPPDKKLCHTDFAVRLQTILEPQRIERRFEGKKGAASYVREVAQMVGGRDCLAPPRLPPMHVQRHIIEKRQEHKQRVFDAKRKTAQQRVEAKIAKADHEAAKRIEARHAEMKHRQERLRHP